MPVRTRRALVKKFTLLAVLVGLVSLGLAPWGGSGEKASPTSTTPPAAAPPASTQAIGRVVEVRNEDMGGSGKYAFDPSSFTFKVGETVTFRMTAETEFHTFTVDELGIDIAVEPGQTVDKTVTFDKVGTFKVHCIPHEALGMVGAITV